MQRRSWQRVRRPARGQALILFAIFLVALLALAGVAIDGLRAGIAQEQAQRAAEAAALAGAAYLPEYPDSTHNAPDGLNATTRARAEAVRNGFTDGSAITVSALVGPPAALQVTIRYTIALTLASVLNTAAPSTAASARASNLEPIGLLQSPTANVFSNPTYGLGPALVGPYDSKTFGDPYSVLCERPGQCSPGIPGNLDHIPLGYNGLGTRLPFSAVPTGTSYLITLPAGSQGFSLWARGAGGGDDLGNLAFSLYRVPQRDARVADLPIAAIWPYAMPPVTFPAQPLLASQILAAGSIADATWVQIPATLAAPSYAPATFRLTVEGVQGFGTTHYAIRLCQSVTGVLNCGANGVVPPGGATLGSWNAATLALRVSGTYPLATISAAYAGRQVQVRFFVPALGGATIALTAPGATSATITLTVPTTPGTIWLSTILTLPPDYPGGTWQMTITQAAPNPAAIFTISATLVGPPIRLVP